NGFAWGAHSHRPKRCPYEECMRVPLIVRYPLLAPQARIDSRIGLNIDFAFTLAELAGLVPPVEEDGRSLVRLLDDTDPAWRADRSGADGRLQPAFLTSRLLRAPRARHLWAYSALAPRRTVEYVCVARSYVRPDLTRP